MRSKFYFGGMSLYSVPVSPKNRVLDGVQIGRIHLQPGGVTSRRCGLSSKFSDHLFTIAAVRVVLDVFLRVWTTHEKYVVVFIAVQNLVVIYAVISIICKFYAILCELGLK